MRLICRECRALLPGYIQRELSPKQRERVSRHLNTCEACYVAYVGQREIVRELSINLPRLGDHAQLDKIRSAVMREMAQPAPKPGAGLYHARYSLAALVLVAMLLLPMSFRSYSASLPTQPRPDNLTQQGTAVVTASPTEAATLTATLQSNHAPILGVTDTP